MPVSNVAPVDVELGIVNTNNAVSLARCLETVAAACEGLTWRMTVLDNASSDGSADLLAAQFPWVQLVRNTRNLGYATTLNQLMAPMLEAGSGRYVALIHEDIQLDPGTITKLVAYADANPRTGLVGPSIRDQHGKRQPSFLAFPTPWHDAAMGFLLGMRRPDATNAGWLDGPCLVFRTEAARQVGPFDERFFIFFEDVDMSLRMHRAGWHVVQHPDAWITHVRHGSTGKSAVASRMELQRIRSRFLYFQKHNGQVAAALVGAAARLSFLLRSLKARGEAAILSNPDELLLSRQLMQMAAYHPDTLLPHEMDAASAPPEDSPEPVPAG